MRYFNLFTLLPFRMALFLLVLLAQLTVAQSGLDMPNFMAWPRGSVNDTGTKVMAYQCGPYCWKSFTPDSLTAFVVHDTTFKLAARGTTGTDTATISCSQFGLHAFSCVVGAVSGTSDSTGFSLDPWPSAWRPTVQVNVGGIFATNATSTLRRTASFILTTAGVPSFSFADSGGTAAVWTNTGTKAYSAFGFNSHK